jgi:hypothetical protein
MNFKKARADERKGLGEDGRKASSSSGQGRRQTQAISYFTLHPWRSTRQLYLDVALLCNPLQFTLQAAHAYERNAIVSLPAVVASHYLPGQAR